MGQRKGSNISNSAHLRLHSSMVELGFRCHIARDFDFCSDSAPVDATQH
jgi:hypothetical protein